MTIMLPMLMAYNMIGEVFHEWTGTAMFAMFIIHHGLNYRFAASVTKGKYTPSRILFTAVDLLLLIDILAMMISAVIISHHVFAFLHINVGSSFARTAHLLGSYWGFILMSVHIGLHFHSVIGMFQKRLKPVKVMNLMLIVACIAVSGYGLYVFLSRKILDYLLLKTQFVFFDFSESLFLFILDYISMIVLFGTIGYYATKLILKLEKIHRQKSGRDLAYKRKRD